MTLGKYTIRIGLRPDNPAFPKYIILVGEKIVGVQFSMPSITDCQWHEHQRGVYAKAEQSEDDYKGFRKYRVRGRKKVCA